MGILILIVPVFIYAFVLKKVLKNYDDTNKRLKRKTLFIVLLTLPFGDHIIGYISYKALCFTNGGVNIYKTVIDEQEQRDYWFYEGLHIFNNSYNDKEYKYLVKNKLVKRGICTNLLKDGNVGEKICAKNGFKEAYLNYCDSKYDTLPKNDLNYFKSCKNADEIIQKYNLKNVIKVPKSSYFVSRDFNVPITPILNYIVKDEQKVINKNTKEVLGESRKYKFLGGLYINLISMYLYPQFKISCPDKNFENLDNLVIPNPYKKNQIKEK